MLAPAYSFSISPHPVGIFVIVQHWKAVLRFKLLLMVVEAVKISDFRGLIALSIVQMDNGFIGLSHT